MLLKESGFPAWLSMLMIVSLTVDVTDPETLTGCSTSAGCGAAALAGAGAAAVRTGVGVPG
jgi:hypothetical protein